MRLLLSTGLFAILIFSVVVGLLFGESKRDAALVKQLGDNDYALREKATQELKARGEVALPALKNAEKTTIDMEIRRRAKELIYSIAKEAGKSRSTGLEMMVIASGRFQMGSPLTETNRRPDELVHEVYLSKLFLLGKHEVTQGQYEKVMKHNPSSFAKSGKDSVKVKGMDTSTFPVDSVSWFDAIEFCNRLSKLDGYKPYYKLTEVKLNGRSITAAKVTIEGGNGYRLPTEAEWEHACRGWVITPFHYGETSTGREANIKPTTSSGGYGSYSRWRDLHRTTTAGSYPPNGWHVHDMHGNVAEWCWDWYDRNYYARSPRNDPQGPETGTHRVVRGGSWLVNERSCRSASRLMLTPDQATHYTGFRVARTP